MLQLGGRFTAWSSICPHCHPAQRLLCHRNAVLSISPPSPDAEAGNGVAPLPLIPSSGLSTAASPTPIQPCSDPSSVAQCKENGEEG